MTYNREGCIALIILLCATVCTAHAATITASPDQIAEGGQVIVMLQDIQDGASFSLRIDADFAVKPGSGFTFRTNTFQMPISLKNSEITATTRNTEITGLEVKKDGPTYSIRDYADDAGYYTTTKTYNISAGIYDHIALEGDARSDRNTIYGSFMLTGEKQGPKDSEISFTVNGIQDGTVTVTALVDSAEKLRKVITIGKGISPVVPTSSGSSGGDGGKVVATPTSSPAIASVDGTVRLTGAGTDGVSILNEKAEKIPAAWHALTGAYTLSPAGTSFSPKATLNFRIPAAADPETGTLFLARYEGGAWHQVPSRIDGDWIGAEIPAAGTYALMTFAPTTTATTSAVMTPTVGETPASENVTALPTTSVPTTPQKSSAGIVPALGALISLLYLAGTQKRE
jgi:hypothetical protein